MKMLRLAQILSASTAVVLWGFTFAASAQQAASMPGDTMNMAADAGEPSNPSTQAFRQSDQKMMKDMMAPAYTGDADKDFVAHMIPHHAGAVSMAEVELRYGKDPEMKQLAREIIKAQKKEIAYMKKWQEKHGGM
jgi:uncharacterized protein (DUF305 family)